MNKVAGLFIILYAASIFKSCENIENFDPQLFKTISKDIHDTFARIFSELSLPDQLQEADRFRLLWIMHNNMNSIAQNYFKIYIDIVNASKVVNKTVNSLSALNNVIEEMAQEENIITVYNSTDSLNLTGHASSHEASMTFISDFTKKFNNFSIADILNKAIDVRSYNIMPKTDDSGKSNRYKGKPWNLQLWLPPNSSEEENQNSSRRMSHVENAVITQFPFIASIHALGEFVCAGAILSNFAVLTAASCLHFVYQNQKLLHDNKSLKIRAGTEYPNKLGLTVSAGKVSFHPLYNPMTLDNNLAIVKLKWSLNFKYKGKNIMRVNYGKIEGALQRNLNKIIMIGWGDKDNLPQNDHLSVTNMDIVELKKCRSIYTEKYVSTNNFCGAILKKTSQAQAKCQRDIGSPAVIGNLLVGLVSYGPSVCAPPSAPTVYTELATYVDWINNTLNNNPVPATFHATTNPPVITAASSPKTPKSLAIHFRQSTNLDKQEPYGDLRSQILAKAQNIVTPLQNSYPEAVKFLSFLLKQIVDSNMRAVDRTKPKNKFKGDSFESTTPTVNTIRSSEEYVHRRPERYGDDDLDDSEPETTTVIDKSRGTGKKMSKEINYSEEVETEDFSLIQGDGLSISVESTKKLTSFTRPETTTVTETQSSKPSKSKDTKLKKNKSEQSISRTKKKIKNFKDLQQVLEKELNAKQDERLRYQKEIKEAQQKKQKQSNEDSEEEDTTKAEIETIIKEVKGKKKKISSGSAVAKDDKTASIRKLIEEILSKREKAKEAQSQITKRTPREPKLDYDLKKEEEASDEDEETEAENDRITTVTSSNTPKPKTQKQPEEKRKKKIGKNKESYEAEIKSEVKKKIKHTVHKQIASGKKATEIQSTILIAEEVLDNNFQHNGLKKVRKPKKTTPHMLMSIEAKSPKTTRKRAFEYSVDSKQVTKHIEPEIENMSTDDSIDSCNSESSKEKTFKLPQRMNQAEAMAFMLETEEESPMLLPPPMADFQMATKDRLVTTMDPNLNVMQADLVFLDDQASNNEDKLATRGVMTIDDLNVRMGIPEEWAFRRQLSSPDTSLEAFVKAGE